MPKPPLTRRDFLRRSATGGLIIVGGPAFLVACSKDKTADTTLAAAETTGAAPETTAVAAAMTKFAMQASWVNDAEFMGYFTALHEGYYAAEGLDLQYLSGGPDVIPESALLGKKAPIAITSPDTTIKAIVDDGAPFVIIGTQYQKSPLGVVSLAKSPIKEPKDLIGKTLAVPPVNTIAVEAMLKASGVDKSQVKIVPYEYDPTPLLKGEIDASIDFTTNVPFTLKEAGEEAVSFLLYDFGYTLYNDTIAVTKDTLANDRELLVKWLRASRKGWDAALADPAKYPPMFADSYFKGTGRSIDNELFFNAAQKPIIEAPGGVFSMTDEGIDANLKALADSGIKGTKDMFDTSLLAEI